MRVVRGPTSVPVGGSGPSSRVRGGPRARRWSHPRTSTRGTWRTRCAGGCGRSAPTSPPGSPNTWWRPNHRQTGAAGAGSGRSGAGRAGRGGVAGGGRRGRVRGRGVGRGRSGELATAQADDRGRLGAADDRRLGGALGRADRALRIAQSPGGTGAGAGRGGRDADGRGRRAARPRAGDAALLTLQDFGLDRTCRCTVVGAGLVRGRGPAARGRACGGDGGFVPRHRRRRPRRVHRRGRAPPRARRHRGPRRRRASTPTPTRDRVDGGDDVPVDLGSATARGVDDSGQHGRPRGRCRRLRLGAQLARAGTSLAVSSNRAPAVTDAGNPTGLVDHSRLRGFRVRRPDPVDATPSGRPGRPRSTRWMPRATPVDLAGPVDPADPGGLAATCSVDLAEPGGPGGPRWILPNRWGPRPVPGGGDLAEPANQRPGGFCRTGGLCRSG